MTEKITSEEIFEACFPFIREDVYLIARVRKNSGKQHLIIRQVDSRTGAILSQDTIDCIHVVLAEIPTDEFDEVTKDPLFEEKTYNSHADDDFGLVNLPAEERFKAFKSWVAGIAEAGKDAFHLQTEIEGALSLQVPLTGRLLCFLARIDPEFLLEHLSYIERASWHEGVRHEAYLIANLLPILDILCEEGTRYRYSEEMVARLDLEEARTRECNEILDLIFDLEPPLTLFMEADRYLQFLLHPRAFPIIEEGVAKTGFFPGLPAKKAAQKFIQEIASYEDYYGVPLVPLELTFLEIVKKQIGKRIPFLDDDRWISRTGFLARYGHITKFVIGWTDQEHYDAIQADPVGRKYTLPDTLGMLTSLQTLQIENYPLSFLPDTIGQLHSLETLFLNHSQLTSLPTSVGSLQSLKSLQVDHSDLCSLPETIGNLSSLESLCLRWNNLAYLPESIEQLKSLRFLYLDCKFTQFPQYICNLESLEELSLRGFNITSIPDEVQNLALLRKLDVFGNKLVNLPESLLLCKDLETLYLGYNSLTLLPDWIGDLQYLKTLTLPRNLLSSLPASIGKLNALEHLDIIGNKITALPPEITQLSSLKRLYLEEDVLRSLPERIKHWIEDKKIKIE